MGEININRREFILLSTLALSSCNLIPKTEGKTSLFSGYAYKNRVKFVFFDPKGNKIDEVSIGSKPHISYLVDNKIFVLTKRYKESYIIDMKSKEVSIINSHSGLFYGHGAVSKDKKYIYVTEALDVEEKLKRYETAGKIIVRSTMDGSFLGEFPSFGNDPHDIQFSNDGKYLIVANGGDESNIAVIEVATKKLVNLLKVDNPEVSLRHFALDQMGNIAVATASKRADLFEGKKEYMGASLFVGNIKDKALKQITSLEEGQFLSVIYTKDKIVATNITTNKVLVFDKSNSKQLAKVDLNKPTGLGYLEKENSVVISCKPIDRNALLLNLDSLKTKELNGTARLVASHSTVFKI